VYLLLLNVIIIIMDIFIFMIIIILIKIWILFIILIIIIGDTVNIVMCSLDIIIIYYYDNKLHKLYGSG
jgi:hypothetical protein